MCVKLPVSRKNEIRKQRTSTITNVLNCIESQQLEKYVQRIKQQQKKNYVCILLDKQWINDGTCVLEFSINVNTDDHNTVGKDYHKYEYVLFNMKKSRKQTIYRQIKLWK